MMMKKWTELRGIKWKIVDVILMGILVVLSADILYLYYSGAWYDPYTLIEITEVVLLYVLLVVGTIQIVYKLRDLKRSLHIL